MNKKLSLSFLSSVLFISCATPPPTKVVSEPIYLCSAYCYYIRLEKGKPQGYARDWIDVANPKIDLGWDNLKRICEATGLPKGPHELQKSISDPKNPGCDFTEATPANSCDQYVKINP